MKNIISASMLASDLTNIEKEIHRTENAQVEWLHIDVMDGVFVDNITYGNNVVAAMRKVSDIYFDTHLMVTDPTKLIPLFAKAGSNMLTIHLESKGNTEENHQSDKRKRYERRTCHKACYRLERSHTLSAAVRYGACNDR